MASTMDNIKLDIKNPAIAKQFSEIIGVVKGCRIIKKDDTLTPDLHIFEINGNSEEFRLIQSRLNTDKPHEIFLTSEKTDPEMLMQAIRMGIKEFFPQPINRSDVEQALKRFKERKAHAAPFTHQKSGTLISVLGSKGGVGTTTIAVNLGVTLAEQENSPSVAILDMNTLFGEIPLFLDITPKYNWGEITKDVERLDDTFLMNVLSKHSSGVHVLPSPGHLNGHQAPTPEIMERLLGVMKRMFDYVVIDCGQSTDETALKTIQMSDEVLLISVLSLPCLANTNKLLRSFIDLGYLQKERVKVVLNRYIKKSEITMQDAKKGIGHDMFWIIPNDYGTTMSAINNGNPLSKIAPRSKIVKSFKEMTEMMFPGEKHESKKKWGFF
ncbi:MAG: AAA family ATPase [Deltaproteobacteria bacterium]|jgi:pilus assembly protein CpaE|nr:AAA family ATPase [Deltaproteobacteria bacterium]